MAADRLPRARGGARPGRRGHHGDGNVRRRGPGRQHGLQPLPRHLRRRPGRALGRPAGDDDDGLRAGADGGRAGVHGWARGDRRDLRNRRRRRWSWPAPTAGSSCDSGPPRRCHSSGRAGSPPASTTGAAASRAPSRASRSPRCSGTTAGSRARAAATGSAGRTPSTAPALAIGPLGDDEEGLPSRPRGSASRSPPTSRRSAGSRRGRSARAASSSAPRTAPSRWHPRGRRRVTTGRGRVAAPGGRASGRSRRRRDRHRRPRSVSDARRGAGRRSHARHRDPIDGVDRGPPDRRPAVAERGLTRRPGAGIYRATIYREA